MIMKKEQKDKPETGSSLNQLVMEITDLQYHEERENKDKPVTGSSVNQLVVELRLMTSNFTWNRSGLWKKNPQSPW